MTDEELGKIASDAALRFKGNAHQLESAIGALFVAQHPEANICMEACGSAHHWGRRFLKEGHEVYLVPAHIAAKYRSGNKNDPNDVLAIYEAAQRPDTYFVAVRKGTDVDQPRNLAKSVTVE